uniref:Putative splicing factor arginine/serine-rich 19 n=1 Tax=Nyssomyia neivai TaxID=330878 RepID=A0A1L8DFH9_9DIPT
MSDSDSDFNYPAAARRVRKTRRRRENAEMQLRSQRVQPAYKFDTDDSDESPRNVFVDTESEGEQPIGKRIRKPGLFDESSADSSGEGEKCPICFATLKEQEVGIPNACTHMYCAKCIEEWARDGKTCPIDRQSFSRLTILENIQSFKVVREVTMPEATAEQRLQPPADNVSEDELPLALRLQQPIDEDSNHSTSSGEKCPICFANFFEQEIGVPDSCGHKYCGRCIEEWSRTVRTCPIDRQTFTRITILENVRSPKKIREISVSHNPDVMVESELEDDGNVTYCTECNQSNFEETMLLCDSCNNGYHMHCLDPPLEQVPDGDWFCATCISCTGIETLFQTRRRVNRVRRTRTRRTRRTRSRRTCRIPLRSLLAGNNRATGAASNVETESGWDGPRLWDRHRAEVPRLAVFGLRDELDYFVSDDESEDVATRSSGSVGILLAPSRTRPSTLQSRKRILTNIVSPQSTSMDLLSNILTEQETWHNLSRRNNIKNVRIGSDGTFDFSDIVKGDKPTTEKKDPPPETQAPMYPRGGRNSGGYFNNNNRGNRGNFRNTSNYNYQGNTYQNSNYNQFNRSGNTSNFGNFQNSGRGGGGNFTNTFQSFQFRNNNNNQNQRGRQQYNQRARGGPFTPNRFNNQRNQNRDNVEEDFSNNTMCSNRQESESDYIENVNESDGDVLNTELPEQADQTDNVDNEEDDGSSAIETIQSSAMNAINSNYQDYDEDECDNNENDEQEYDEEYPPNESCDFTYPNVTPILPAAPATNYPERDEEDDCPNFSVYSAEAMKLANNLNEPQNVDETQLVENQQGYEEAEEDLVQLDDDEENADARNEEQLTNLRQIPINNDAPEEKDPQDLDNIPIPAPSLESIPIPGEKQSSEPPVRREKKGVLELYDDSDWEELNLIKTNEDRPVVAEENLPEEEEKQPEEFTADPRSYTPCLDENNQAPEVHKEDDDDDTIDISANPMDAGGIGGMDTELISDEDGVLNNGNVTAEPEKRPEGAEKKDADEKKGGAKSRGKKTKEFKKLSRNNRDRNYRDRERGRDRSRSYSNDKENDRRDSYSKRKEKRKDLARYDVRNVVEDRWQRRGRKDQYGRDTSRHRSLSSSPKRNSLSRSPSRRRSMSFSSRSPRRSLSRGRQPHRRRSLSRNRRNRRSASRRRSISRRRSPLRRRSFSRRRSLSRRRSPSRRRSFSRKRSLSRKRDRSYNRSASPRRFTRSRSMERPARGSRSPAVSFRRSRSRISPRPPSRERAKQPKRKKTSKDGRNKPKKIKKKHISTEKHATPEARGVVHKRKGPNVDEVSSAKKSKKSRSRSKSWNGEGSRAASFSMSPPPGENYEGVNPTSWTPPLNDAVREEFAAQAQEPKMRKKEKKRKQEKKRGDERRSKRAEKQSASKEVFASGNNILVSVSFNNDEPQPPQQTISVTLPPTKDGLITKRKTGDSGAKKSRKEKSKRPSKGSRKKRIDSKPVAIIDLDRPPFKEMTPSPKAVIVLSDSDGGDNGENNKGGGTPRLREMDDVDSRNERREIISQSRSPNLEVESTFTLGPKTPPEPEHIKFTLKTKNKTKSTRPNVLADEDEEELPSEPEEIERHNSSESVNKIGPNTPPEPAPCSPDAYDPFEPTKSPSQSRSPIAPAENSESAGQETSDKSGQAVVEDLPEAAAKTQEKVMNPVDLVMALMNSTTHAQMATDSHNTSTESQQSARISASPQEKPEEPKASSSGITIISNVLIQPSKSSAATSTPTTSSVTSTLLMPPIQAQTGGEKSPAKLIAPNVKPSPMKTPSVFTKTSSGSLISKLPLPKVGNQSGSRHNGDQDVIEMDSPYSPASSDFDGLFDPPAEQPGRQNMSRSANTSGQSMPKATPTKAATKAVGDIFDALFGGVSSPSAGNAQIRSQQKTKTTKTMARGQAKRTAIKGSKASTPVGLDEASMRIVDEVPGSAVELHFLRKLNRQERVVEEVKLVLKPHYNKKHITKDEYKDILRKAVPKICHSRTGEINPQKIQTLIEAYVRKFRIKRKISGSQPGPSGAAKNVKSLWA